MILNSPGRRSLTQLFSTAGYFFFKLKKTKPSTYSFTVTMVTHMYKKRVLSLGVEHSSKPNNLQSLFFTLPHGDLLLCSVTYAPFRLARTNILCRLSGATLSSKPNPLILIGYFQMKTFILHLLSPCKLFVPRD